MGCMTLCGSFHTGTGSIQLGSDPCVSPDSTQNTPFVVASVSVSLVVNDPCILHDLEECSTKVISNNNVFK